MDIKETYKKGSRVLNDEGRTAVLKGLTKENKNGNVEMEIKEYEVRASEGVEITTVIITQKIK